VLHQTGLPLGESAGFAGGAAGEDLGAASETEGQTRITSHDPAHSLLFDLITHRGKSQQIPPIASNVVVSDEER